MSFSSNEQVMKITCDVLCKKENCLPLQQDISYNINCLSSYYF